MSGTATGAGSAVTEAVMPNAALLRPQTRATRTTGVPAPTRSSDRIRPAEPGEAWTDDPYADAVRAGRGPLFLRRLPDTAEEPRTMPLDIERWCSPPDAGDRSVLRRCTGPVLDVGCGPGRLVSALAALGVPALGVDLSPAAVARTRRQGGAAVRRSAYDRLPGEGRWSTALLMDGNVGIGGDPVALLGRVHELVAPGGCLLAEAAPQDVDDRFIARVEDARGRYGRPFPWARLGPMALLHAADATGWILTGRWTVGGRPFVELHRPKPERDDTGRMAARRAAADERC
ncbi:methyltransferase domain-containing protein [Streptomyces sp. NPDC001480]|uniref:methyltransferase domain-containing protein n=1 Tax=Streptomyces sp. NPDC001480 TaxID=3364577 RepID=UPI00367CD81A